MSTIVRLALCASLGFFLSGCHTHSTPPASVKSRPAVDSLNEMTAAPNSATPANLRPESFDYKALLGEPPPDNSRVHQEELEQLLKLQTLRTLADEKRCQEEVAVTAFGFANVLGSWFNAKDVPYTAQLMHDAGQQAKAVSGGGKKLWSRIRPPLADPRIHPCVPLEKTFSYPSGHATIGAFWGTLLGEMFPDDREMLLARGKQIGFDRNIAGMHWPTDVIAGEKLGKEIARRMLTDPQFHEKLMKAKEECLVAMTRIHGAAASTRPSSQLTPAATAP